MSQITHGDSNIITPPRFVYNTLFDEAIYKQIAACEAIVNRVNQHRKVNNNSNTTLNVIILQVGED